MSKRREKKSETIEVRLPYSQKTAFMGACQEKGISASEALRSQIDTFIGSPAPSQKRNQFGATFNMIRLHSKKSIATLTALATSAALFAALPSSADEKLFDAFDKNNDGVISLSELGSKDDRVISILDQDGSGDISRDEFRRKTEVIDVRDNTTSDAGDGKPEIRTLQVERTVLELQGEGSISISIQRWAEDIAIDASEADVEAMIGKMRENVETMDDSGPHMHKIKKKIELVDPPEPPPPPAH